MRQPSSTAAAAAVVTRQFAVRQSPLDTSSAVTATMIRKTLQHVSNIVDDVVERVVPAGRIASLGNALSVTAPV
jgi:hypothetical protein